MDTEQIITTTMPAGYTSWRAALADARKSPAWKDAAPFIRCWVYHAGTIVGSAEWGVLAWYEKAHMVAQAEAEQARRADTFGNRIK